MTGTLRDRLAVLEVLWEVGPVNLNRAIGEALWARAGGRPS